MKNKDARSLPPDKQEDIRKKAVHAVLKDGKTRAETAKTFGVSRQRVELWVKEYRKGGMNALRSGRRGRPAGGTLSPGQSDKIIKLVKGQNPTRKTVVDLVKEELNIGISLWTAGRYLARWGFKRRKA